MDDVLRLFLAETREALDVLDAASHDLSRGEWGDVADALRVTHSFKGAAAFLDEGAIETVAHAIEALLSDWRDGLLPDAVTAAAALQAGIEAISRRLTAIESGSMTEPDVAHVLQALAEARERRIPRLGDLLVAEGAVVPSQLSAAVRLQRLGDPRHLGEILVAQGAVAPDDVLTALTKQRYVRANSADLTVAVPAGVLQRLSLVAEEFAAAVQDCRNDGETAPATARWLEMIQAELAEQVRAIRYQAVGDALRALGRGAAAMAAAVDKQVRVVIEDDGVLLDRAVLARLTEALRHLLRNAVDHGIEEPSRRIAAGKDPVGVVTLSARCVGDEVHVTVRDDGDGIDLEAIRSKAWNRGDDTSMAAVPDETLLQMIFLPGFTTAHEVTRLSGRGVGMDAVAATVAAVGGTIRVTTKPTEGTQVTLVINGADAAAADVVDDAPLPAGANR